MKCKFVYCVHNNDCECALKEIRIGVTGMCEDNVPVVFDKNVLELQKERQLRGIKKSISVFL